MGDPFSGLCSIRVCKEGVICPFEPCNFSAFWRFPEGPIRDSLFASRRAYDATEEDGDDGFGRSVIKVGSVAMRRPDRANARVHPMSALGQKQTSRVLAIYVRFRG